MRSTHIDLLSDEFVISVFLIRSVTFDLLSRTLMVRHRNAEAIFQLTSNGAYFSRRETTCRAREGMLARVGQSRCMEAECH